MLHPWELTLALLLAAAAAPAAGQQAVASPPYLLPRPAETGKPLLPGRYSPEAAEPAALPGCAPAAACRLRLFGAIEKNGAVMLRGTAFSW
jgi:hypothetical protein